MICARDDARWGGEWDMAHLPFGHYSVGVRFRATGSLIVGLASGVVFTSVSAPADAFSHAHAHVNATPYSGENAPKYARDREAVGFTRRDYIIATS